MQLAPAIRAYFDADLTDAGQGTEALLAAFAPDAEVRDEGNVYHGHHAIGAWWSAAKKAYSHRAVPFEANESDGVVQVRATVTGNFPSSPATLTYRFMLRDDAIAALEISA